MHYYTDPREDECEEEYTVLKRRIVRATRKPHKCYYCGQFIPVGASAHVTVVLTGDGKVFSDYRHNSLVECN